MRWKSQGVVCAFLLLFAHQLSQRSVSGKKTVKLIVPHKIKYIHHTHVLLVKPKKKSSKIQVPVEEVEEDEPARFQHLHYHDNSRHKGKPKVHYVVSPYVAEAKEGDIAGYSGHMKKEDEEENESYYVPVQSYRKARMPPDEAYPHKMSILQKRPANHHEVTAHSSRYPTRYLYPPEPEFMETLKTSIIDPQQYDTKYLGYSSYSEMEPSAPYSEEYRPTRISYARSSTLPEITTPKSYYNSNQNYMPPKSYSKWVN